MEVPLLQAIVHRGGSIWFSEDGDDLEEELADHFDLSQNLREYASPEINAKGHRKWPNIIQFVRLELVDRGELDNSTRDLWLVTEEGYRRLGMPGPAEHGA